MPYFGTHSNKEKQTLHPDLRMILDLAIKYVDFSIIEGYRNRNDQNLYYQQGKTKVEYPNSKHNNIPALAVDIVPWVPGKGTDWKNKERYYKILFYIKGIAFANNIILRLGADWDGDFYSDDHSFLDLPHIELKSKLINGKWNDYDKKNKKKPV